MPAPSLPSDAKQLAPGSGSITRRLAGDVRLLATGGYALLLQVAHPTVGAGVTQHSNFKADPWGRLLRTLDYSYSMVYGGPELAARTGRRVREMHVRIEGVRPDGERYRALDREPYAWVHATLADSIVTGYEHFVGRLAMPDIARFYAEWRRLGRLIGVDEDELPGEWRGFREYFDAMVAERLEGTEAVHDVLASLARPAQPPLPLLTAPAWRVARLPLARLATLGTVGLLPPSLRERLGIDWSRRQALELRGLSATARSATPLLPRGLRNVGPAYLRWRGIRSPDPRDPGRPAFATAG